MSTNTTPRSALVIGATAGIGEGIALDLARRGCHVTIAGRNAQKGAAVVERLRSVSPASDAELSFRRLDASTLAATHTFATEFAAEHDAPLHALVMCQSVASFGGREETSEGLELKLVLHAYTRYLLARDLLPLLRRGGEGAGARVLSVLSGGVHGSFSDWDDPDLKRTFSLKRAADAAGIYNDLALQHLADQAANQAVAFLHAAPGFVATNWGHQTKGAFAIKVMQKLFAKSAEACGRTMGDVLHDPRYAHGFHTVNPNGNPAGVTKVHTPANIEAMMSHLEAVLESTVGASS